MGFPLVVKTKITYQKCLCGSADVDVDTVFTFCVFRPNYLVSFSNISYSRNYIHH